MPVVATENSPLTKYIPKNFPFNELKGELRIQDELIPVLNKIKEQIPHLSQKEIWRLFSETQKGEDQVSYFPYCRVDIELDTAKNSIEILETFPQILSEKENFLRIYGGGSKAAFKALVWVELGFGGLESYYVSSDVAVWPYILGVETSKIIMTYGKSLYEKALKNFTKFRFSHQHPSDLFDKYHLVHLLKPYRG